MQYTDILIDIRKILRSINLESKRIQKEYGLSIPQYLCLNYLNNQEDYKSTSKSIKQHLNLNASTVTGIIGRLEAKGFLAKLPNKEDKRSSFIYLTALGEKVVGQVPTLMHEKLSEKLQDISDEELNKLREAVQTLVNFMGVSDLDASPLIVSDEKLTE